MASIILQAADQSLWTYQIVVTAGTPAWESVPLLTGLPQAIILVANASNHYQLVSDDAGNIDTSPTQAPGVNGYALGSDDCSTGWIVGADANGNVTLRQIVPWNPGPVVGQLFPPDGTLGNYTQPGGIGTLVYPQQDIGQRIGLFSAGCGHWFSAWYIQSVAVCGVRSALIGCPVCGYLQQIVSPFSLIYTDPFAIILG